MEPVSLSLGALVAALAVKAAEKAGEAAMESGAGVLGRLLGALRERFAASGDQEASAVLARVEDPPVGEVHLNRLAAMVDAQAGGDAAWGAQVRALVEEAERTGVNVAGVVQQVYGHHNVTVANTHGSTITIHRAQPPVD